MVEVGGSMLGNRVFYLGRTPHSVYTILVKVMYDVSRTAKMHPTANFAVLSEIAHCSSTHYNTTCSPIKYI